MWCTRWYLPLVLLPLPIAPPYFLVLFIFSTTLHARPCFYCVTLLTALFLSSCYWPPIPVETALSVPWANNATTFAEAIFSLMPELPLEKLPSTIPIVDHCWCDLSSGQLFEPFNITNWELESLQKVVDSLRVETKNNNAGNQSSILSDDLQALHSNSSLITSPSSQNDSTQNSSLPWRISWGNVWPFSRTANESTTASSPISPSPDFPPPTPVPEAPKTSPSHPSKPLGIIRREYNLRTLGFDLIVDFGWSRRGAGVGR